ncbi:MAG: enoyl-CoA hydratase/isomerase family protein, partial [Proteobacteria bacterium]
MTPVLSLRDARAQLRTIDVAERYSSVAGAPLLAVALDSDAADDADAARALAALPAPAVALLPRGAAHSWAARFDAVVADEAALAPLATAIRKAPLAAAALVQLLRGADTRSLEEGLVAESLAYSTLQGGPEHRAWLAYRAPVHAADERAPAAEVVRDGDVLRVTLARPKRRNAWSAAMRDAVHEAFALALADATLERVVWAGRGVAFCAGGDLAEFGSAPDPATAHAVRTTRCVARLAAALGDRLEARLH